MSVKNYDKRHRKIIPKTNLWKNEGNKHWKADTPNVPNLYRLKDLGLTDFNEVLSARGWNTLAGLAFSAGSPGFSSIDAALDERVIIPVLGSADHIRAAQLRRLYFEAYTVAAAEM